MTTFNQLNVQKIVRPFEGDKISIDELVNKDINLLDFEICNSTKKENSKYLRLQVLYEGKKRYLSTGGKFLIDILSQVQKSDLPIETKIMKNRGYYFEGTIEE